MDNQILQLLDKNKRDIKTYEKFEKIYVDPQTVITIIETGSKIYSFFKKKKAANAEEIKYLKKIYAEVIAIRQDLQTIINLLTDLKVFIVQNEINNIIRRLYSEINTINLSIISWLEGENEDLKGQLRSIITLNDELQSFGYAHLHVCILSMHKELDLCIWLKKPKSFVDALLSKHKDYFSKALTLKETPGKLLEEVNLRLTNLETEYQSPKTFEDTVRTVLRANSCGTDGYKITKYTLKVTGNILDGFAFSSSEEIIKLQRPVNERCGGGGCGGNCKHQKELEESLTALVENEQSIEKTKQNYLDARELYLTLFKSKLELTATVKIINQTIEFIDNFHKN